MQRDETVKHLLEKGYTQYKPTRFDNSSVVARYQKRFDDDTGKKYFIDAVEWEPFNFGNGESTGPSFEYETQLYRKDTHDALNLNYHSSWTIEQVEENLEALFATGLFDYYETWDEC